MANRRMINKDDFESLEFQSLTIQQRFLFLATCLYADDDGIIPFLISRSKIYPMGDVSCDEMRADYKKLEEQSFVILYCNDEYVQICNWWDRQFIDKKLYKPTKVSQLPPGYKARPTNLTKYHYATRVLLEQNSEGEERPGEIIKVQNILEESSSRVVTTDWENDFPLGK